MQQILIDVDELRTISTLSVESAIKMDEANTVIGTVVSQHDWKCPERVAIDEALETIKSNVLELNETFSDFASKITEIANAYTEFINMQIQMDNSYLQDIASHISSIWIPPEVTGDISPVPIPIGKELPADGMIAIAADVNSVVNSLEKHSLDTANIASLHGAANGVSIMDFSVIRNE